MTRNTRIDHPAAVAEAQADPGVFKLVGTYPSREAARSAALRIARAERMPSYLPAGAYEAYAAQHEDGGTAVWARYVEGLPGLEPRPVTMTYRVNDRGTGLGYEGVKVVTVEVAAECPRCGGPRGEAAPVRFHEDGDWYVVDRWHNLCGHVDSYVAVLAEYRKRRAGLEQAEQREAARAAAVPADAGEFTEAVALLNTAATEVRGLHAKQAAQFLDGRGHGVAARRIEEEVRARRGHMSARQAAVFLTELGLGAGGGR